MVQNISEWLINNGFVLKDYYTKNNIADFIYKNENSKLIVIVQACCQIILIDQRMHLDIKPPILVKYHFGIPEQAVQVDLKTWSLGRIESLINTFDLSVEF